MTCLAHRKHNDFQKNPDTKNNLVKEIKFSIAAYEVTAQAELATFDFSRKLNGAALQVPLPPICVSGILSVPYQHAKGHGWYQQISHCLFSNCFSDLLFFPELLSVADIFHGSPLHWNSWISLPFSSKAKLPLQ